jgi:hypothetical protein
MMSLEQGRAAPATSAGQPVGSPITSLDDPRAIQILSTEHWSVLSARSLAYNEAFTRGGMFLTFLSMSFVALALLAQAMAFGRELLGVAAVVLAFDFVVGLTTYGRIAGANADDLRAMHGMARIRHAYTQIAPLTTPYFTTATHDDVDSVTADYGAPDGGLAQIWYGLTTSLGMIGLIVSMLGGVLATIGALLVGIGGLEIWIGLATALVVFASLIGTTMRQILRNQAALLVRFPAPSAAEPQGSERAG